MVRSASVKREAVGPMPTQARLVSFITTSQPDAEALRMAAPALLDTIAVTIAGGSEPGVRTLAASLDAYAADGAVPSFWADRSYRADDAALLTGMASHVLDYDDVCMLSVCHPSAPIISALLSAPRARVNGREFLDAYLVGTEILIRLGQAMGFRHYAIGFHATATLGTIGAAAACARLMKLDPAQTAHALAIAASLASGLRVNFGSMVKSLHVGLAASNGLKAARLARAGITGAREAFDGEGFFNAFSGGVSQAWPDDLALGAPFAIAEPGFEQKRYPCCYMLHKIIEATLALRRDTGLRPSDLAGIVIEMPRGGTKPLIHPHPRTGLNALFSAPYAAFAALADGRIDLASFTDAVVLRPEIQARLQDVTVVERDIPPEYDGNIGAAPVTVTLQPRSGRPASRTIIASPGSKADPLTPTQLRAKWIDCLRRARPDIDEAAGPLFDEGMRLADAATPYAWIERLVDALVEK